MCGRCVSCELTRVSQIPQTTQLLVKVVFTIHAKILVNDHPNAGRDLKKTSSRKGETKFLSNLCLLEKTIHTDKEKDRLKASTMTIPKWRKSSVQAEVRPTSI